MFDTPRLKMDGATAFALTMISVYLYVNKKIFSFSSYKFAQRLFLCSLKFKNLLLC